MRILVFILALWPISEGFEYYDYDKYEDDEMSSSGDQFEGFGVFLDDGPTESLGSQLGVSFEANQLGVSSEAPLILPEPVTPIASFSSPSSSVDAANDRSPSLFPQFLPAGNMKQYFFCTQYLF